MRNFKNMLAIVFMAGMFVSLTEEDSAAQQRLPLNKQIRKVRVGEIEKAYQVGNIILAGQPKAADLKTLKTVGVQRVINLYRNPPLKVNEMEICRQLNMEYQHLPFDDERQLNDAIFNRVRTALLQSSTKPVLLHCKSNDRVGAVWAAFRTLDQGIDLETAIREAKAMGLKTAGYEQKLRNYVARMLTPAIQVAPSNLPGNT